MLKDRLICCLQMLLGLSAGLLLPAFWSDKDRPESSDTGNRRTSKAEPLEAVPEVEPPAGVAGHSPAAPQQSHAFDISERADLLEVINFAVLDEKGRVTQSAAELLGLSASEVSMLDAEFDRLVQWIGEAESAAMERGEDKNGMPSFTIPPVTDKVKDKVDLAYRHIETQLGSRKAGLVWRRTAEMHASHFAFFGKCRTEASMRRENGLIVIDETAFSPNGHQTQRVTRGEELPARYARLIEIVPHAGRQVDGAKE